MFGTFAVLFYLDGSVGYRKKNESYYLHKTFQIANDDFAKKNAGGALTAEAWRKFAETQSVVFPDDRSVLPAAIQLPRRFYQINASTISIKMQQGILMMR